MKYVYLAKLPFFELIRSCTWVRILSETGEKEVFPDLTIPVFFFETLVRIFILRYIQTPGWT